MGDHPKKGSKGSHPQHHENKPSDVPTTNHATKLNHNKQHGKIDETDKGPKQKSLDKNHGRKELHNVTWVLEAGKGEWVSEGHKVTLEKRDHSAHDYFAVAMLMEDGAGASSAPVSGDHFWTAHFGGVESGHMFFGITNSRWLKEPYGLFYSGILSKHSATPKVEFGPVIKSGDVIGALCSFSNDHLNIYFYHNGRCLGLSFQVPASLFLPEGIHPCVKLNEEGTWATITKEPKEKIPKEEERIRAPVSRFGVEGIWRFKSFVDSKNGKGIHLDVKETILKSADLTITELNPSHWLFEFWFTHYVGFAARKMDHHLWIKSESHHTGGKIQKSQRAFDHSLFPDFPIIEILNHPEKVDFHDQDMRVTKAGRTVIFFRFIKIRKGNVFKNDNLD